MLKEFKEFIAKGNVIEMAVGLIMATYFGAIVKALVDKILMPFIGLITGGVDFGDMKYVLKEGTAEVKDKAGEVITKAVPELAVGYGDFINTIITFLIVAFCVFLVVRSYNKMKERMEKKEEEAPAAPPEPSKEEVLLTEIRDLLKK